MLSEFFKNFTSKINYFLSLNMQNKFLKLLFPSCEMNSMITII